MRINIERDVILQLRQLKTWFPVRAGVFRQTVAEVKAVDGVDLDVYRGETLALVGESGCGKSTLGKSVLRLIQPTGGRVIYKTEQGAAIDLSRLSVRELRPFRSRLQIVFQDPYSSLNPAFTIAGSFEDPLKQFGARDKAARRKRMAELLEAVNLPPEYLDRYPNEFSGGQRQRIGIARALSVNPELVICDEATSGLDVSIRAQVLNLLEKLKRERKLTYIFITHDLGLVEYMSDRVAVMYLGKIVELCPSEDLYHHAMHPYTRALLEAVPSLHGFRPLALSGDVPSPINPPGGCAFHPRCPRAAERCKTETPEPRQLVVNGNPHIIACHLCE
jgi:oligopeptide/dipeptide ABC transporter ATP-binding protein